MGEKDLVQTMMIFRAFHCCFGKQNVVFFPLQGVCVKYADLFGYTEAFGSGVTLANGRVRIQRVGPLLLERRKVNHKRQKREVQE